MQESAASVRVVIADDHHVFRVGLRAVLAEQSEFQVVGEADSARAALALVVAEQPDVAILDMRMRGDSGLSIMSELAMASPDTRVLMLSMHEEPEMVRSALASGVHGYVNKAADPAEIVRGVRAVAAGRSFLSVRLERAGLGELAPAREHAASDEPRSKPSARPLSDREREILGLFACGLTQRQIADRLGVRLKTIETYRSRLGDKFAVRSRAELVRHARELGLVQTGIQGSSNP